MADPFTDFGVVRFGTDSVSGTDGRDILISTGGNATLDGGWGSDVLLGGPGDDLLIGGRISLVLHPDDNLLFGGDGNDTLRGFFGNDTLIGGAGDDRLEPSAGQNVLVGGEGSDVFRFGYGAPLTPFRQIGSDVIWDFQPGVDKIDLSAMNYLGGDTDLPYRFIGTAAFSGTEPEVRITQDGNYTVVELDTQFLPPDFLNGGPPQDGVADGAIRLVGNYTLAETDFFL